jgi:nucleoside-diphosphate-sugar epimerase
MGATLITGADGYVGRMIAAQLAGAGEGRLILAVRAADSAELAEKRAALDGFLGPAMAGRASVASVDLRDGRGLDAIDPGDVTAIVHSAAVSQFNVDKDTAAAVNRDGTARLCEFASRCDALSRLLLLSTVYSAGRRTGKVEETAHPSSEGFVNYYEWSKWAAEDLALTKYGDRVPLTVLRLPTVVADHDEGVVTQYNAFHHTLKLFFYGLMSVVPGDETTPIHVTTGAYCALAAERLLDPSLPGGIYHACSDDPPTFRELIDTAFTAFEADAEFRRRNLVRPPFCDIDSFRDLVHLARSTRSAPVLAALEVMAPFADQLYLHKDMSNDRLRAMWPDQQAPDQHKLIANTCEHLVATRWGRRREEAPNDRR